MEQRAMQPADLGVVAQVLRRVVMYAGRRWWAGRLGVCRPHPYTELPLRAVPQPGAAVVVAGASGPDRLRGAFF